MKTEHEWETLGRRLRMHLGRPLAALACVSLVAGLLAAPVAAGAADAVQARVEPASLAALVGQARHVQPRLSPDGQTLAILVPLKGKRNLVLLDLQTRKPTVLTGLTDFDVVEYRWVGSQRLVFSLGRLDTPTGPESGDGGGLFAIKRDGTGFRKLNPTVREQIRGNNFVIRSMGFLAQVPGSEREILVSANLRQLDAQDVYRIDLESGARELLTFKYPGRVRQWLLDHQGLPRVAVVSDTPDAGPSTQVERVLLRDSLDGEWRELARFEGLHSRAWRPVAFADNKQDLIVTAQRGKTTRGLHLFQVASREFGPELASHPRYDLLSSGLLFDASGFRLLGLRFDDERQQTAYFDDKLARLQSSMEASFPGKTVLLQTSEGARTLVQVFSDRSVPTYYLYDEGRKTLEELLRSRDGVEEAQLVPMRPFLLKTRDGLEIPSYYFLPADHQLGQRLPTVLHIHGGPHARADRWGALSSFGVVEAQVLASRGYAVVLPNFRITPELGARISLAGLGQLGRKMSEDHEDAAAWAVQQGFADPARLCISGASYGGYASLWALAKTPDLFKCAVAGLVVSDVERLLTSSQGDIPYSKAGVAFWRELIGQNEPGWARAHEVSPALHAERIKAPVFMYAGSDDWRTPMEQTNLMVDALKKAGHPPEVLMIKAGEGHGYGKTENRIDLYEQMLKFLDRHIGPGSLRP